MRGLYGMRGLHGMRGLQIDDADASDLSALQSSAQAIVYAAGIAPVAAAGLGNLAPNTAANMARWSPDTRALMFQTRFAQCLNSQYEGTTEQCQLDWIGTPLWQVIRPGTDTLVAQVGHVRNYIDQRQDRGGEILAQLGLFSAFYGHLLGLTDARNPKTFELLNTVQLLAGQATMLPKHQLACRRPDEVDARILPLIQTPGHGSFPSGHATQAFAMAEVLVALIEAAPDHFADRETRVTLLYRQAHRIAVNRTVAGVHFPMDSLAGAMLGLQIGRGLVGLMTGKTRRATAAIYDPNAAPNEDFLFNAFKAAHIDTAPAAVATDTDPLFAWLWQASLAEFGLNVAPGA